VKSTRYVDVPAFVAAEEGALGVPVVDAGVELQAASAISTTRLMG
jgi:hypothetical protein